jgi:hypothetical protein
MTVQSFIQIRSHFGFKNQTVFVEYVNQLKGERAGQAQWQSEINENIRGLVPKLTFLYV